jgi:hypothetical protein
MKKVLSRVVTAVLICSAGTLSSCFYEENPVEPVNPQPMENPERLEFEAALSGVLDEASKDVRLDKGRDVLKGLCDIMASMDAEALKELKYEIIQSVLYTAGNVFFEDLSEEENAVVRKRMKDRFAMTEEDLSEIPGFMIMDANKVFGHLKVTFQDGKATVGESDVFTIENIDKDGRSTSMTMKFSDDQDGVRFFVDRYADITPIAMQFPKQTEVMLKTADGLEMPGTLSLSSISPFQYISVMGDEWHLAFSLTPSFDGHHDTYNVSFDHYTGDVLDVDMNVIFDGVEKLNMTVRGAHDFKVDINKLNSLNNQSVFADFLAVLDGGVADEFEAVIHNKIVAKGKVNDISACMKALDNIRNLYGKSPGYAAVDVYTQQINQNVDISYSLKGHTTAARSSLVTYKANADQEEYLPYVALQFPGESAPMVIYDRMSVWDKANYRKFHDQINVLGKEIAGAISILLEKIQLVKDLEEY